jgi:hypothetical protein
MPSVVEVILDQVAKYNGGLSLIHQSIHGSVDPVVIGGQLDAFVSGVMGSRIREGVFHGASVGSVTGVVLDDGREVVVKAYQPRWSHRFLTAVIETQSSLADAGLACARPLAGPLPFGQGLATVESFLVDPGQPAEFGTAEMASSAHGLAELIALACETPGLVENPTHRAFDGLYPPPHSPLFDFTATARGARWIDELAAIARPHINQGTRVVAHTDWSARNIRLGVGGVRAIYDLDSLAVVPLPAALGTAAVTWRSTGEAGDNAAPGLDEIETWLDCYPEVLSPRDRQLVVANALYTLAYSSRCEHAIDPDEHVYRRARPTLADQGAALAKRMSAIR